MRAVDDHVVDRLEGAGRRELDRGAHRGAYGGAEEAAADTVVAIGIGHDAEWNPPLKAAE